FNSVGQVIGITTFGQGNGGGIAGIIRIEEAQQLLSQARAKLGMVSKPGNALLPVEPADSFPIAAIKEILTEEKFDVKRYTFGAGDFEVSLITPPLEYRLMGASEMKATKEKQKRNRKHQDAIQGTFQPLDDLKSWG